MNGQSLEIRRRALRMWARVIDAPGTHAGLGLRMRIGRLRVAWFRVVGRSGWLISNNVLHWFDQRLVVDEASKMAITYRLNYI
jgi:hypothetical protein